MSLEYLLLGLLNHVPQSGYDLHKQFGDLLEQGWNTDRRQVYYLLHKMEKSDWLEVEIVPQEDNPTKKVYHITEAGREALHEWVRTPRGPEPVPFNWMGQLFMGHEVGIGDMLTVLRARLDDLEKKLAGGITYVQSLAERVAAGEEDATFLMFRAISVHHGFTYTRSELAWVRKAIEWLEAVESGALMMAELSARIIALLLDTGD